MQSKDLWTTEVGSDMWGMFVPGKSDHDYVTIRQVPTNLLLRGYKNPLTWPQLKTEGMTVPLDQSFMEIEHLVNLLIKGNINALWAVMSPIIVRDHPALEELKKIVISQPNKLPYHSIKGMAISQQKDELKRPALSGGKGYRTAARTLLFGYKLLTNWTFNFKVPTSLVNTELSAGEVYNYMDGLEYSYQNSKLPERPNEEPFRQYLYKLRCNNLLNMEA